MTEILGEIRPFLGDFAPVGWLVCDGSAVPISQYSTLHNLIGDLFGTAPAGMFLLPNLVNRIPLGSGAGPGLTQRGVGQMGGSDTTVVTEGNLPPHSHQIMVNTTAPDTENPVGAGLTIAPEGYLAYANPRDCDSQATMAWQTIWNTPDPASIPPGAQAGVMYNGMPSFSVNYIISVDGIYPDFGEDAA